jgi:hypothetical protein
LIDFTSFRKLDGWPPSARFYAIAYSVEEMLKNYAERLHGYVGGGAMAG